MSKQEIGSIPKLAQKLITHLPEIINDELKRLITRAEAGDDTTFEIINLFSKYEVTHLWIQEQINPQCGEKGLTRDANLPGSAIYSSPPGYSSLIPFSKIWVCPKCTNDHWIVVIREGEDPPLCKKHKIEMLRESKQKG
jgi:hypothetical protein